MIQFNLLPDVKMAYIKAKRLKMLMISISTIFSAATVIIGIGLYIGVNVAQKSNMTKLNAQISTAAKKVTATPDIDKIITVQNQLKSLSDIHGKKPAVNRLFSYLSQITPKDITISSATVDLLANTVQLSGQGPDLHAVNTFVDTVKFTSYANITNIDPNDSATAHPPLLPAFSNTQLSSFSANEKKATYQISFSFDPLIFSSPNKVSLVVPDITTTRSQQPQPQALFEQAPIKKAGAQ